jgi:glutamate---cysteine ligase / carboxylate-amine ligase
VMVERLIEHVEPALRTYGDVDQVRAGARRVLADGTGADRQRAAYARSGGALVAVVADAVNRTTADR